MTSQRLQLIFSAIPLLVLGCSAESGEPERAPGAGGVVGVVTGGAPALGGTPGAVGGTTAVTGGSTAAGGTPGVGGTVTTTGGTATGQGGTPTATGGTVATTGGDTAMGGTPATGGTVATTGGDTAMGGTVTGTGGDSQAGAGAGTGGTATSMPCPGCAEISIPFTAYGTSQSFEIYIDASDFSTTTINFKIRKVAGKAGGVQIVAKDGEAQSYAYGLSNWTAIDSDISTEWTMVSLDVANPGSMSMDNPFDAAQVKIVTIQVSAGDPWYSDEAMTMVDQAALLNPTVLQIDEITLTSTGTAPAVGPWTFDANAMPLTALTSADMITGMTAVSGAAVTWVGP